MKIYLNKNVYEAALDRIRYIFDEFPVVVCNISGGKDSTVVLNLCLEVAKEKNRLPLKVLFIDQEAEWLSVIEYIESIMTSKDVDPYWFQIPLKLFNATSHTDPWLNCWQDGADWIRDKHPLSIKENIYKCDRFKDLFGKIMDIEWKDNKACYIAGVRAEESPSRFLATTQSAKYKTITYGKATNKALDHYTFYPIYDWSYTDVWKYIHDNKIPYCRVYDLMYQYGVPVKDMRVSNVHHETAVHTLFYMQEIEGENWSRITERLSGINTAGQLGKVDFFVPNKLPFMFKDWKEYRDYLLDNLVSNVDDRKKFKSMFDLMDKKYNGMHNIDTMYKQHINTIMTNDYYFTKLKNWENSPEVNSWRKFNKGITHRLNYKNKFITG